MKRVVIILVFIGVLSITGISKQGMSFAVGHRSVITNISRSPVVQKSLHILRNTSDGFMRKIMMLGLMGLTACGTIGCSTDNDPPAIGIVSGEHAELDGWEYRHYYVGRRVYFHSSAGVELGIVLAFKHHGPSYRFIVQRDDGEKMIIFDSHIGGELLEGNQDVGAPVELVGYLSDQRLTGIITAAYGGYETETKYRDGVGIVVDADYQVVDYYVVKLDSGESIIVASGSITAWLD